RRSEPNCIRLQIRHYLIARHESIRILALIETVGKLDTPIRCHQTETVPTPPPRLPDPATLEDNMRDAGFGQLMAHRQAGLTPPPTTTTPSRSAMQLRRVRSSAPNRSLWLRDDAHVRLRLLPLAEELLGLLVGDGAGDDHVLALLPVHRRRHLVVGRELQRIDH